MTSPILEPSSSSSSEHHTGQSTSAFPISSLSYTSELTLQSTKASTLTIEWESTRGETTISFVPRPPTSAGQKASNKSESKVMLQLNQ